MTVALPDGLPEAILEQVQGADVTDVSYGKRGVVTYNLTGRTGWSRLQIRLADAADPFAVIAEVDHLDWIDRRLPAPKVLASEPRPAGGHAAVLALPAGNTLLELVPAGRPAAELAALAGRALARIHALDVAACPFSSRVDVRIRAATRRVRAGLYESAMFSEPHRHLTPDALLAAVTEALGDHVEVPVVGHGSFGLDCVVVDGSAPSGVINWVRAGAADAISDLASGLSSVGAHLGEEFGGAFLHGYGSVTVPDPRFVAGYQMLAEFE